MTVSFIHCYARSGGTMLNRCLNNLNDLVVLSEVHPVYDAASGIAAAMSIKWQAREWYGLELRSGDYLSQIRELHDWCEEKGKHLVVRDWTYIDFAPSAFNGHRPPNRSRSFELLKGAFEVNAIAFIRNAVDVGLSLQTEMAEFSAAYLEYARYLARNRVTLIRYEDFCRDPGPAMAGICAFLGLPQAGQGAISCDSRRVNGDIWFSRGNRKGRVVRLKRKYVPAVMRDEIDSDADLREANRLLGYPAGYGSCRAESLHEHLFFSLMQPLGNLKRRVGRKLLTFAGSP